jgi:tetratricopeptide (TPR) repeat protein
MKKAITIMAIILCGSATSLLAQNSEEAALIALAKAETMLYLRNDSVKWEALFIQSPKTSRYYTGRNFYVTGIGWKTVSKQIKGYMKVSTPILSPRIDISNYTFNISDNLATMIYDQKSTSSPTNPPHFSKEQRTFVKENGQWKLTTLITIDTATFTTNNLAYMEDDINLLGYTYLEAKKFDEAIEVFKLNVKLHPDSWNPYDSLAEGYAAAGNKKMAIKYYEKSAQLNPKNDNGKQWITKLKK